MYTHIRSSFQSQPRSQPPGDGGTSQNYSQNYKFQSQPRSQPPGDSLRQGAYPSHPTVSISTEKPTPWRQRSTPAELYYISAFQSQPRSQPPGDSSPTPRLHQWFTSF